MKEKQYPYIAFFLVKFDKRNVTYDEIYKRQLMETIDYYNKFGKEGFLSEKMYIEDVDRIAERDARAEYDRNKNCVASIERVVISRKDEVEIKSLTENRKDFIRWIGKPFV
jgi:hypothetical protein